jgi:glycoside/pentoside/hexuronide:cation symporter, GPH family
MNSGKLTRKTLISYSMGSFIETSIYGFCGLYLLNFYTDIVHLSPKLIGYALSFRFFIDAISDPILGYFSDKTHSRLGRRRPYFFPGAIVGIVSFYLLLTPPIDWSEYSIFFYLLITSSVLFTSLTVFGIPYFALSWELTSDYNERTRISSYRRFFEAFAEIFSNLLIPVILALSITGYTEEVNCYPVAALSIGFIAFISVTVTFFGTSEYDSKHSSTNYSFQDGLKLATRNKPFLILLITFTFVAVADRLCMALLFYLLEFLHGVPKKDAVSLFLAFFAGSLISSGFWMYLAKYIGKKQGYIAAIIFWGIAFGSFAAYNWSLLFLHIVIFFMGVASSGVLTLPGAIIPDVIELDQIRTGQRREGIYAGIAKFFWKMGTSTTFLVIGYLLTWIGYEGGTVPSESTIQGLRFIFIGGPIILLILAVILFLKYPINQNMYIKIQRIANKRNQRNKSE